MGGYNDGLTLFLQIQKEIRHHLRRQDIQTVGGLIENYDLRILHQ